MESVSVDSAIIVWLIVMNYNRILMNVADAFKLNNEFVLRR